MSTEPGRPGSPVLGPGTAMETLLGGLIDYAGLYPPAGLDMRRAVENYFAYRSGRRAFALGRFIVDVNRIDELRAAARNELGNLRLSLIIPADQDATRVAELLGDGVPIESIETRPSDPRSIAEIRKSIPAKIEMYIEVPIDAANDDTLAAIADAGARLKLRMGGVVPGAFPPVESVAQVLGCLQRNQLPFKATAGLHHPLRSLHRLTYAADSPTGMMHGFINLICAAALVHFGGSMIEAVQILEEQDPGAWSLSTHSLSWRSRTWTVDQLSETRRQFMSFGSCSFEEPIRDLEAMGWL